MATATATLAPSDLPERYELSDGELVPVGYGLAFHELIKTTVLEILTRYWLQTKSGRAFCESMFPLRSDRARIPDVAWVVEDRLAQIPRDNRAIAIASALAGFRARMGLEYDAGNFRVNRKDHASETEGLVLAAANPIDPKHMALVLAGNSALETVHLASADVGRVEFAVLDSGHTAESGFRAATASAPKDQALIRR